MRIGSKRALSFFASFLLLFSMLGTMIIPQHVLAAAQILYAAPTGSGDSCSEAEPCSLDGVQAKVRTMNGDMTNDIMVYLRGGAYNLTSSFTLDASDSGSNGYSVIYQAYPNESPIFEGGQEVTGWTLHDADKNIYKANVGSRQFRQLYVEDQRAIRARTPNQEDAVTGGPYYTAVSVAGSKFVVNASEISDWANLTQVETVWRGYWMEKIGRIQSYAVNGSEATLTFQPQEAGGFNDRSYTDMATTYYHFENAYEFIDAEGEWYLNTSEQSLYYKPRTGEDMSSVSVITPVTETLVNITGTDSKPVHHLQMKGITFQHSNWTKPSSYGLVDGQSMVELQSEGNAIIPGAVVVSNANNITFEGNTFTKTGAHGLLFKNNSDHNVVTRNTFTDTSAGGVYSFTNNSSYDTISFNTVENFGQYYTAGVGILASKPDHMIIDHNTVQYGRTTGISLGWQWDDTDTGTDYNQIKYNLIHDVMQLHDDGGGIYSLGKQKNTTRYQNYIYGLTRSPYTGGYPIAGIYLDNGSTDIAIENNVLKNTVHAFYARNTPNYNNLFRNNFYNTTKGFINGTDGEPGHAFVPISFTYGDAATEFIHNVNLGTERNDFTGWTGMKITIGSSPVTVKQLGRWVIEGNTGTHTVKLVDLAGADVASVEVPTAGSPVGFKYVSLASEVILSANTSYYMLSSETSGGDLWYNDDTTLTTTNVGIVTRQFYTVGSSNYRGNTFENNTLVSDAWPSAASAIMNAAGADSDATTLIPVPGEPVKVYEAEDGTWSGQYTGKQYASSASGSYVVGAINNVGEFAQINDVNGNMGGIGSLVIRYANGTEETKSLSLYVNGFYLQHVNFAPTGSWNTFQETSVIEIPLNAGVSNTIKLQRDLSDNPAGDIDRITVSTLDDAPPPPVGTNIALGKNASQSSTDNGLEASRAVDGSTDGNGVEHIAQTQQDNQAWWMVDLGANYNIGVINIWNRTDKDLDHLSDYYVRVLDENQNEVWQNHQTSYPYPNKVVNAGDVKGRFVKIQLTGQGSLQLAEVQVYGELAPQLVPAPPGTKYEAEDAALAGGAAVFTDHKDYSGTGFVAGFGNLGASVTFTVNAATAGNKDVALRYVNANDASSLSIYVGDTKIQQIILPGTGPSGDWDAWGNQTVTLPLAAGDNTITYKYEDGDIGRVNLDYIAVSETTPETAFEVGNVEFTNLGGDPIEALPESGMVNASVSMTNHAEAEQQATLIVALFDAGGDIQNLSYLTKAVAAGDTEHFTAGFKLPASHQGYTIKVMVWDNLTDMNQLSDVVTLQ